jgi:hypothetical protein
MNKYEKLGTFLVRLACAFLLGLSAFRLVLFLYAALATDGFRMGNGWPLLVQSTLPGIVGLLVNFARPQIVSYLARDLGD